MLTRAPARTDTTQPPCATHPDPETWFSDEPQRIEEAKLYCGLCPLEQLRACGQLAVDESARLGVYAGYNTRDAGEWEALQVRLGLAPAGDTRQKHRREATHECVKCGAEFTSTRKVAEPVRCVPCRQGHVDAGPARKHLEELATATRASYVRIAACAGLPHNTVLGVRRNRWIAQKTDRAIRAVTVADVMRAGAA
ncbi:WhiB family transcriptional regulator [Nocardia sp. CA-290969]|uniref:WhiB family transcriptional regulator n=1 Tax=Nocardia sp. CA-290969 TaxID=3239986 RepID=UPI003D8ADD4A